MKILFDTGCITKIKNGVKILGRGSEILQALASSMGTSIHLEANDASTEAISAVKATGGSIEMNYRTPLILRQYLKPHKFPEYQTLKTPMPSPKQVLKLEKIRDKGINVNYPDAPWLTYNRESIENEKLERIRRIAEAENADMLPSLPADRSEGVGSDRPRIQRKALFQTQRYV